MNLAGIRLSQGLVVTEIFLRHPLGRKPLLEMPAHLPSIEFGKSSDCFHCFRFPRHDKASYAVVDDLWH